MVFFFMATTSLLAVKPNVVCILPIPRGTALAAGGGVTVASVTGVMTPVIDSTVGTMRAYVHRHWPSWLSGSIGIFIGVLITIIGALCYKLYNYHQAPKHSSSPPQQTGMRDIGAGRKKKNVVVVPPLIPSGDQAFTEIPE